MQWALVVLVDHADEHDQRGELYKKAHTEVRVYLFTSEVEAKAKAYDLNRQSGVKHYLVKTEPDDTQHRAKLYDDSLARQRDGW